MHQAPHLVRTLRSCSRLFTSYSTATKVEQLRDRSLLQLSGTEVPAFLQGLITNDMKHMEDGAAAMYSAFLNLKGRVLCDSLIYRYPPETGVYFIECASDCLPSLEKHLKLYRIRRKVDIKNVSNEFGVWVTYNSTNIQSSNLFVVRDPRLKELGHRIIAPISANVVEEVGGEVSTEYRDLRYRLGVGEGSADLPSGNCFPLEANCDYLHGVSFHKGCYIGQEVTARTHHTGVVRKRLMPLQIMPSDGQQLPEADAVITAGPNGRPVGKVRGFTSKGYGLALLRVAEALKEPKNLRVNNVTCATYRPEWWPAEISRDRPAV